jgi:hypothetical protein
MLNQTSKENKKSQECYQTKYDHYTGHTNYWI